MTHTDLKIRIVLDTCLSISQIKTSATDNILLVCVVKDNVPKTEQVKKTHFTEFEILYLHEPTNIIYVSAETYISSDNYKDLYEWVDSSIERGDIKVDNPGPYIYL